LKKEEREKMLYEQSHKTIDGVLYKKCNHHNELFPDEDEWFPCTEEYFYKNKCNGTDGLNPECKRCSIKKSSKQQAERYESELRDYHRKRYNNKKDYFYEKAYKYKSNNLQKVKIDTINWQRNNKDKIREYQEKRKYKNHIISKREWDSCKEYFNNECAYCGISQDKAIEIMGQSLHKEHLVDCGKNDLKNCIPACRECNSEKHTTSLNDWYNVNNSKFTYERYHKIYLWVRYDCKKYIAKKKPKHFEKIKLYEEEFKKTFPY
jgi:hypothetical protein